MTRAINRVYSESGTLDPQFDDTFTQEQTDENPNSHLVWVEIDGITRLVNPYAAPHDVDEAPLVTKYLPGSVESQMNMAKAYRPELKQGIGYIGITGGEVEGSNTASYLRSTPDPRFLHHEPGYRI